MEFFLVLLFYKLVKRVRQEIIWKKNMALMEDFYQLKVILC
jgi:hypothetical protein